MNKKKNFLQGLFFVIIISTLGHTIWSQEKETKTTFKQKSGIVVTQKATSLASSITKEDIIREAQRSLDRSINILNLVANLIGILITLLGIVIAIAGACGFFEYRRWKTIREDIEKRAKESEDKIKQIEKDAEFVKELRNKAEKEVNVLRDEVKKTRPLSLTEKPPEEVKEKLDEFSRRLETLEMLGVSLNPEDYFNRGLDLYFKGKSELALKAFEKVIEIKPDYAEAWAAKGATLGELGRDEEALKAYDKAIEIKPDYAEAWYNRACVYSLKGDKENALKDLYQAIKLDTSYKEKAKKDEDFKNLWDDKDLKKIIS